MSLTHDVLVYVSTYQITFVAIMDLSQHNKAIILGIYYQQLNYCPNKVIVCRQLKFSLISFIRWKLSHSWFFK